MTIEKDGFEELEYLTTLPEDFDPNWLDKMVEELPPLPPTCSECIYYNGNEQLPCAVNPSKIYQAENCKDYELKE